MAAHLLLYCRRCVSTQARSATQDPAGTGDMPMGNGEAGGKLPELAGIAEEMPFELKVLRVLLC